MDDGLTIAELAQRTGLTTQTLRSYERSGLLAPDRSSNGRRRYSEDDLARIRLLSRLRATGMTVADARDYAELARSESETAARRHEVLVAHRQQVLARIDRLHDDLALIEYEIQRLYPHNGSRLR
ncbi:MerR family transcriptional regulator [Pseudonocardia acaciae]|uniref:MerR family transcriptional regulator n=1 Tax=Pseudonocardia acaciae TaxID=551276 RepID=UPI000AC10911|nr:MerR family transcriptional regulator [Pseudonocardia acaciae]